MWDSSRMKISINLSQGVADWLARTVKSEDTNASIVCEAALLLYQRADPAERIRLQRELLRQRRPPTPTTWRALFWEALAEEFGVRDMAGGEERYLMAPRPYCDFQVIFDAAHSLSPGHEHEIVVFTDTAPPYTERTVRLGTSWSFTVGKDSVFDAARKVAAWLRENEGRLQ